MLNPIVIELGDSDSIVITKNGKVVAFVDVEKERNGNTRLLANPVSYYNWETDRDTHVHNSFATTLATSVDSLDDLASAENFIRFMTKVSA
jgi:hypothetical protein